MEDCQSCRNLDIGHFFSVDDEDEDVNLPWAGTATSPPRPTRLCETCRTLLSTPFSIQKDFLKAGDVPSTLNWDILVPGENTQYQPLDGDGPFDHHSSFGELRAAALGGCFICRGLIGVFLKAHNRWHREPYSWPEEEGKEGEKKVKPIQFRRLLRKGRRKGWVNVDFSFHGGNWVAPFNLMPLTRGEAAVLREGPDERFVRLIERTKRWISHCSNGHKSGSAASDSPTFPTPKGYPSRLLDLHTSTIAIESLSSLTSPQARPLSISLIERHGSKHPLEGGYAALSHCWGSTPFFVCKESTYNLLKSGISPHILPKTFQDAIIVVRALGIRYLWIDSLCIMQDSATDWQREGSRMDSVYSNACVTLSATGAKDGSEGLFLTDRERLAGRIVRIDLPHELEISTSPSPSSSSSPSHCPEKTKPEHKQHQNRRHQSYIVNKAPLIQWREEIEQAPINSRAWVLQERLLSQRIMHFSRSQVYLECTHGVWSESWPHSGPTTANPGSGPTSSDDDNGPLLESAHTRAKQIDLHTYHTILPSSPSFSHNTIWMKIVEAYTRRSLSFPQDRLPAVSALAGQLAWSALQASQSSSSSLEPVQGRGGGIQGNTYAAGLFERHFVRQLLWSVAGSSVTALPTTRVVKRIADDGEPYIAPSWSWASSSGAVDYDRMLFRPGERKTSITPLMGVEKLKMEMIGVGSDGADERNCYGQCRGGKAYLHACVCPVTWSDYGTFEADLVFQDMGRLKDNPMKTTKPKAGETEGGNEMKRSEEKPKLWKVRFKMLPSFDKIDREQAMAWGDEVVFLPVLVAHSDSDNNLHGLVLRRVGRKQWKPKEGGGLDDGYEDEDRYDRGYNDFSEETCPVYERIGLAEEYDSLYGAFGLSWMSDMEPSATHTTYPTLEELAARWKTYIRSWRLLSADGKEGRAREHNGGDRICLI